MSSAYTSRKVVEIMSAELTPDALEELFRLHGIFLVSVPNKDKTGWMPLVVDGEEIRIPLGASLVVNQLLPPGTSYRVQRIDPDGTLWPRNYAHGATPKEKK